MVNACVCFMEQVSILQMLSGSFSVRVKHDFLSLISLGRLCKRAVTTNGNVEKKRQCVCDIGLGVN